MYVNEYDPAFFCLIRILLQKVSAYTLNNVLCCHLHSTIEMSLNWNSWQLLKWEWYEMFWIFKRRKSNIFFALPHQCVVWSCFAFWSPNFSNTQTKKKHTTTMAIFSLYDEYNLFIEEEKMQKLCFEWTSKIVRHFVGKKIGTKREKCCSWKSIGKSFCMHSQTHTHTHNSHKCFHRQKL